jgi:hypothetical protein
MREAVEASTPARRATSFRTATFGGLIGRRLEGKGEGTCLFLSGAAPGDLPRCGSGDARCGGIGEDADILRRPGGQARRLVDTAGTRPI